MSYGVASRALLFPKSELSWALLRDIVYLPYWQLYGELQLEEIEGENNITIKVTKCVDDIKVFRMVK